MEEKEKSFYTPLFEALIFNFFLSGRFMEHKGEITYFCMLVVDPFVQCY